MSPEYLAQQGACVAAHSTKQIIYTTEEQLRSGDFVVDLGGEHEDYLLKLQVPIPK
ncbi:hypothetical protein ACW9KT_22215 [Hymenobacter sp. HD11105]